MKAVFIVLALLPVLAFATLGVDISQPTSQGSFQCMRNQGYTFAVARVHMSTGRVDPNGANTIRNAWAGGMLHVDGYIFPCPTCGDGAAQIRNTVASLRSSGTKFGMLWLDVEGTQYWRDQAYNRAFFNDMANQLRALGVNWGVYTSASQWNPIMGNWAGGAQAPLWYAHYDGSPSFSDFRAFGGWTKPAIKQYRGDISLCGAGVDANWYP